MGGYSKECPLDLYLTTDGFSVIMKATNRGLKGIIDLQKREKIIRLWFDMWLQQEDMGIDDIFAEDAVYIESWGPKI